MAYAQQRRALSDPAPIRILVRLTDVDVPVSAQPLSNRLSQWLSWTDAITPSSVSSTAPPASTFGTRPGGPDAETIAARVRATLAKSIVSSRAPDAGPGPRTPVQDPLAPVVVGYTDFWQRYVLVQQTVELGISELRDHLWRLLITRTPDLARLTVLDANMEQALTSRKRSLLEAIPAVLARCLERLRAAKQQRQAELSTEGQATPSTSRAWLDTLREDMQSVLLAELDVRFQPIGGLLTVLRPR